MDKDYSILIVPGFCIIILFLKYIVQKLYKYHSAKLEEQRLASINAILRNNPLTHSYEQDEPFDRPSALNPRIRLRATPPPDYENARRNSLPISYIKIEDPDPPPPSYEQYIEMSQHQPITTI